MVMLQRRPRCRVPCADYPLYGGRGSAFPDCPQAGRLHPDQGCQGAMIEHGVGTQGQHYVPQSPLCCSPGCKPVSPRCGLSLSVVVGDPGEERGPLPGRGGRLLHDARGAHGCGRPLLRVSAPPLCATTCPKGRLTLSIAYQVDEHCTGLVCLEIRGMSIKGPRTGPSSFVHL